MITKWIVKQNEKKLNKRRGNHNGQINEVAIKMDK